MKTYLFFSQINSHCRLFVKAKALVIDIKAIAEPLTTARSALKCSDEELREARKPRQTLWQFDYSKKMINENITLQSDDKSLFTQDGKESIGVVAYAHVAVAAPRTGAA